MGSSSKKTTANFADDAHRLDAGLFFIGFVRDPQRQFVPIQRKLSRSDVMMEYLEHTGSAVFAVPGGLRDGDDHWGRTLLA